MPEKGGYHVLPTLVEIAHDAPIVKEELFVPITYVLKIKVRFRDNPRGHPSIEKEEFSNFLLPVLQSLEEAIAVNNSVPQGLSSSIFTNNQKNVFKWIG